MSHRRALVAVVAVVMLIGSAASAVDVPLPGKVTVVKQLSLAKFKAIRTSPLIPLPTNGGADDPTIHGAQIRFYDTGNGFSTGAGDFLHNLPAAGWSALGNPPGSAGYKYKGADAGDLICKVVLIKDKKVKATCKGAAVTLNPPYTGNSPPDFAVTLLGVPNVSAGAALRYCTAFGGTTKKNDTNTMKRKDAPQPGTCPDFVPTFTPTNTRTPTHTLPPTNTFTQTPTRTFTNTPTVTPTRTFTNTPTATRTATNTFTQTPTRTFTNTPTNTPTRTFTNTPTRTPTQTPTSTPTDTPDYVFHKCVLNTTNCAPATNPLCGSFIQLYIAALGPVPLKFGLSGSLDIAGGLVPLGAGKTSSACDIQMLNPVNIPAIGFVCISPSSGCAVGERDCDGGNALGVDVQSDGNVGACTSNAQCITQCDTHCGTLGGGFVQFSSSCTGYCTMGAMMACTTDAQCNSASQGACNGPDPVGANGNICQCTCIDNATHGPSDPGDLQCNLGSDLVVETGPPCNGTDVLIPVGQTCIPVTTQRATSLISDANFIGGSFVPDGASNDLTGANISCPTLDGSTTTGLAGVGAVNFFGSALGDLAVGIKATCQ